MIDLNGKRAIITGAASGVGAATAATFGRLGASVTVADIVGDGATAVADGINNAGGTAIAVTVDVTDEDQVAEMIGLTKREFGGIDVLHNNAAALSNDVLGRDRDLTEMTAELWDLTHAVNLRGVMFGCKHAVPVMLEQGSGCIVNTTSTAGQAGDILRAAYGSSKAGVEMFTKYVATMYGHRGIRANAVAPGLILSPIALANLDPAASARFRRGRLIERAGTPDDIASMVAYLASDLAGFITGQVFNVDGGVLAHAPSYADNLGEF
ncbi:MAG: SDR family oxidoreductase [Ilumatobacteraceae bacterium]|nr:SDR family oxidoreductase [Ilumatobacteraceae bacterium]